MNFKINFPIPLLKKIIPDTNNSNQSIPYTAHSYFPYDFHNTFVLEVGFKISYLLKNTCQKFDQGAHLRCNYQSDVVWFSIIAKFCTQGKNFYSKITTDHQKNSYERRDYIISVG